MYTDIKAVLQGSGAGGTCSLEWDTLHLVLTHDSPYKPVISCELSLVSPSRINFCIPGLPPWCLMIIVTIQKCIPYIGNHQEIISMRAAYIGMMCPELHKIYSVAIILIIVTSHIIILETIVSLNTRKQKYLETNYRDIIENWTFQNLGT